ncbi:CRAL-TRIO domain-containing protein [Neolecta irregularis DAH-3]|uniref:CRAL-TRIO domain-containing protein n=1 Tax=Neolecta irregularis (strain DAH-3) TaxID=1198029 RepID=A0A1U7LHK9_NEOID|nr:CRAL-TRIO domain-containing protein [Neolecta irregularis DAH-3]|eukprot:OLL22146.1 CRAL-TRIO domain-containing protein [Neolecta irregularis DAH-3]
MPPKPKVLPGRPGNLSPDQEQSLKDLWAALFAVFDFPGSNHQKYSKQKLAGSVKTRSDSVTDKYAQKNDFQNALANTPPHELRAAFWRMVKQDNPDALLLRFLRARKWDVNPALVMLVSTMHWRVNEVEHFMEQGEEHFVNNDKDTIKQIRLGKSFTYGYDLKDRPVVYIRARLHRSSDQSQESTERYTVYLMETIRLFLNEPVDQTCIVFDLTDFSISNMDYPPVKFLIKCLEAHYPESLGQCIIHKAPWIFQGIWTVIKGWLDPVVASKFVFTRNLTDIEKYISPNQLLKEVGGNDPYEYTFIEPLQNENKWMKYYPARDKILAERAEIVSRLEGYTRSWYSTDEKVNQQEIRAQRTDQIHKLCENYRRLDPYVRARSIYDRNGSLKVR